ncbi:MAG: hypothetical protein ABSD75_16070 [Terriglobales bacterium]
MTEKLADCNRPQPETNHPKFRNGKVDTSRKGFRLQLQRMLRIVGPQIPLNPPNWLSTMFNHEDMRRLRTINPWTIFLVNHCEIEWITPPRSNVGGADRHF